MLGLKDGGCRNHHGSSLVLDYDKLGYSFIAYVGVFLNNTSQTKFVLQRINEIPFVTSIYDREI
jgi:hypothetical protein